MFTDSPDTVRRPRQYERLLDASLAAGFTMNSDVQTGALLRTLAAAKPGGRLLELGTGCGLGASWLLDGMDAAASLVSVDNNPAVQAIARAELGGDARVTFVAEDGGAFLERCTDRFDLMYADAWPGKFSHLDEALALLNPGGVYVIDDMLPQPNWATLTDHPPKVAALLERLDARADLQVTRLAWSTGLVLCVKGRRAG